MFRKLRERLQYYIETLLFAVGIKKYVNMYAHDDHRITLREGYDSMNIVNVLDLEIVNAETNPLSANIETFLATIVNYADKFTEKFKTLRVVKEHDDGMTTLVKSGAVEEIRCVKGHPDIQLKVMYYTSRPAVRIYFPKKKRHIVDALIEKAWNPGLYYTHSSWAVNKEVFVHYLVTDNTGEQYFKECSIGDNKKYNVKDWRLNYTQETTRLFFNMVDRIAKKNKESGKIELGSSGLHILTGPPGTGKTALIYRMIKDLTTTTEGNIKFLFLSPEIFNMFSGDKLTALLLRFSEIHTGPVVLILEDAAMFVEAAEDHTLSRNLAAAGLKNLTDGITTILLPHVHVILTHNSAKELDQAVTRANRCLTMLHVGPLDNEDHVNSWLSYHKIPRKLLDKYKFYNESYDSETVSLAELYELKERHKLYGDTLGYEDDSVIAD